MFPKYIATVCLPIALFCLVGQRVSLGQEFTQTPDAELVALGDTIEQFFKDVAAGETETAYQQLLDGSQLSEPDQAKALADLITKTQDAATKYGEYRGAEQVALKRVGTDVVLMKYLYKCKQFPVVWYFTFYRTGSNTTPEASTWRVVNVRFDTNLELLWF